MDSSDDRIVIENVNVPGSTTRVSRAMYQAMKQAMWEVLPASAPGLTQSEMCRCRRATPAPGPLPGRREGRAVGSGGQGIPGA